MNHSNKPWAKGNLLLTYTEMDGEGYNLYKGDSEQLRAGDYIKVVDYILGHYCDLPYYEDNMNGVILGECLISLEEMERDAGLIRNEYSSKSSKFTEEGMNDLVDNFIRGMVYGVAK